MAGHTRLFRRGATYYHRCGIPTDIKDSYPKSEETFSLKTKDYDEALKLVRIAAVEVDEKFEAHRQQLKLDALPPRHEVTRDELEKIGKLYYAHLLLEDEDTRHDGFYDAEDGPESVEKPSKTFEEHVEDTEALDAVDRDYQKKGKISPFYLDEATDVLTWSSIGIRLDPKSPAMKQVARELQKASILASKAIDERNQGEVVETPPEASQDEMQTPVNSLTLQEVFEKYVEEREPHERTVNDYRAHMNRFLQVMKVQDIPVKAVTPQHIRQFKDSMLQYPARLTSKLRGMTVPEILKATKGDKDIKRLSAKTVNEKCLTALRAIFGYALRNGHSDTNPAQGISVEVSIKKKKQGGGRKPYSVEDMNTIFNTFPVYTKGERPKAGCGEAAYWLPLLAAFTGARLEELGQIRREDIKRDERNGIDFIDLTGLEEAKNLNSRRKIPVHPELARLGFLTYVKTIKEGRIFPDLKVSSTGKLTASWSKWWGRYARQHGEFGKSKVFHSFRHTAKDGFREGEVLEDLRDELMGHAPRTVGESYGEGSSLKRLAEGMCRLSYPGLNLDRLYQSS